MTALTVLAPMLVAVEVATAVEQPVGEVITVALPSDDRAAPRYVNVLGRTDDGHLVLGREADPTYDGQGEREYLLVNPDGSEESLDRSIDDVVGERLINQVGYQPKRFNSRLVSDSAWTTVDVPEAATVLGYTVDGVLVATGLPGARSMTLFPWDGGPTAPVPGIPAGGWAGETSQRVGAGSLLLVSGGSPADAGPLLVDTAIRRSWSLGGAMGAGCEGPSAWGINDGVLAWQAGRDDNRSLCSVAIPDADDVSVGPVTKRPAATIPVGSWQYTYRLMPVGDDIVMSSSYGPSAQWGDGPQQSLIAVAPDGATRTLAGWGYDVLPAAEGHVVAVTGDAPGQSQISDIDVAAGAVAELKPIESVRAWRKGVAIDRDRVVYTDSSIHLGAALERTVDFDAETVGPATLLDSDVTGPVVAGAGSSAWSKRAGVIHLTSDGTRASVGLADVLETDERWVRGRGGQIVDTVTGQNPQWLWSHSYGALLDGVHYFPGYATQGGPKNSVVAIDLDTGRSTAIAVSGCASVSRVQVAGSWMLASCTTESDSYVSTVVDRSGSTPQWQLDGANDDLYLGNGFAVRRAGSGELTWTPLAGATPDWRPLGTAAPSEAGDKDWAVAVSRGSDPTVAWIDGTDGFAARLPVATSALPAHPDGVAPPVSLSGVWVAGVDGAIYVNWDRPAAAEAVTGYTVTITARDPFATNHEESVTVGAGATSALFRQLSNGYAYDVAITTYNIAGWTRTKAAQPATPLPRPSTPYDIQVSVDRERGRATVTWSYAQAAGTEPARSFSVDSELAVIDDLPAGARSATFGIPRAWVGAISVIAQGVAQSSAGQSAVTSFPAPPLAPSPIPTPDTVAPVATLGPLPAVVLDGSLRLDVGANDDRALAVNPLEVRWRTSRKSQQLGSWTVPASWRATPAGRKRVWLAPGEAACFSARARDAAGNVSPWSEPRCSVAAVDDQALRRVGKAQRVTGKGYFRGEATVLSGGRSSYLLARVTPPTTGGWLVARTCPSCGRVKVVLGSTVLGTIDLRSKVARNQRLLPLPRSLAMPQRGRLKLMATGPRGEVVIDGFALRTY